MSDKALPLLDRNIAWSPASAARLLKDRLALYRRSQADLSLPRVPAAELYLLANRFRHEGGKVAPVIAEIDAELEAVMPNRAPARRRWA